MTIKKHGDIYPMQTAPRDGTPVFLLSTKGWFKAVFRGDTWQPMDFDGWEIDFDKASHWRPMQTSMRRTNLNPDLNLEEAE
jgi:hypothetical protein